nr:MAG TPA: hypothetical protein [Caudoviricetes sp.]
MLYFGIKRRLGILTYVFLVYALGSGYFLKSS